MISNQIFEALTILKYMLPCNFIKRNVNKSLLFHFEPFANRQLSKENLNFYGSSSSTGLLPAQFIVKNWLSDSY